MDVIITNSQFKENCLKQSCIDNFKKKLNTPRTRNTFQKPIDLMLKDVRKVLDPESEQFKKDADVLKTYFNYSDKKVDSLMNIKMVYDDNNDWVPINKLNTNYSDLSVLITDILIGEGECICKRLNDLNDGNGSFMLELSNKMLSNPEYYYTKLAQLKLKMIESATKDAHQRAEKIAENGGGSLGKLKHADMGVFQITAENSSEEYEWGGSFNTSSRRKTANITIRLKYALD